MSGIKHRGLFDEIYSADGSDPKNLTNHFADDLFYNWSPDGKYILFKSSRSGNTSLYIMDINGLNVNSIAPDKTVYNAVWSPSGEWIAFTDLKNLYRIRPDGTDLKILVKLLPYEQNYNPYILWSPDSNWILYYSYNGQHFNAYLTRSDGTDVHELVPAEYWYSRIGYPLAGDPVAFILYPDWSPDSNWIVFESGLRMGIFKIRTDGQYLTQLTDTTHFSYPVWSPPVQVNWNSQISGGIGFGLLLLSRALKIRPFGRQ